MGDIVNVLSAGISNLIPISSFIWELILFIEIENTYSTIRKDKTKEIYSKIKSKRKDKNYKSEPSSHWNKGRGVKRNRIELIEMIVRR